MNPKDQRRRIDQLVSQKDVPGPTTNSVTVRISNLGAVDKLITIPIDSPGFAVVQRDHINSKFCERVQLPSFRYSVVIKVLPKAQ